MASCCQKSETQSGLTPPPWWVRGALLPIIVYRYFISPLLGPRCRFEPSCSLYALGALEQHGLIKGSVFIVKRLGKCHPWHPGGYDPVPKHPH